MGGGGSEQGSPEAPLGPGWGSLLPLCLRGGRETEREGGRERQRERDTKRRGNRKTERQKETERDRQTETGRQREAERASWSTWLDSPENH